MTSGEEVAAAMAGAAAAARGVASRNGSVPRQEHEDVTPKEEERLKEKHVAEAPVKEEDVLMAQEFKTAPEVSSGIA
jgi:hypothetical protein